METKYNSVVVYKSWIDTIKKLPIGEIEKYDAIMAILDYGFNGLDSEHWAVDMVREQIDVNNRRRENGRLGGRPKNQTETKPKPNDNQTETKEEPNVNVNDNVNDNLNDNSILKERESKENAAKPPRPTIDEVKEYVKEKKYTFDPEAFFSYYESNGWMIGKNKMKNWKAACVTWQRKETEYNNNNKINKTNNHGRNNNDHFSGTGYTGDTI